MVNSSIRVTSSSATCGERPDDRSVRDRAAVPTHNGDVGVRTGRPRFTVVLPVRDRADVVGRAVAGVLAQTFADLELVVVDLGSTDRTLDAVEAAGDPRVEVLDGRTEAASGAAALLDAARGTWITFIDADCEVSAGWLARLGRLVDATVAGFASCGGLQHDDRGGSIEVRPVDSAEGTRACFRPGAFTTTTDRMRSVVELIGSDLPRPFGDRHLHATPHPDDGCIGHLGRAALDLTLLDGDPVAASPELLVAWHERSHGPQDPTAAPELDEVQLRAAFQGLDALSRAPIPDGELLARYATAGGVAAARLRQNRDARRLFRIAWRARPEVRDHWSNLVAAHLGPIGRRSWAAREG